MSNSSASSPASTGGNYRWVICCLLFMATSINYIDRQILSLLKPDYLDPAIGWTNEQFGYVTAFFQAAYAIGLFFFGWFIDKYGTKIGYTVSIVWWSLAAMGHALVMSFWGFVAARIALGLGEGGNFPAAIKTTAHWHPKKERAFATSLFNSGANVGAILAPATIPWIAAAYGWHAPFVIAGLLGFVWLVFWVIYYEIPERQHRLQAAEREYIESDRENELAEERIGWWRLLNYRQTWSFIVAKFLTDPVWWFFLTWLPDFFKRTRGLDLKHMGLPLVTIYTIVTVLSIAGGYFTGHLIGKGWPVSRARKTGLLVFALCVLPIFLATQMDLWGAVALIGLAGAAHQAWSANLFTSVSDMFPKRAIASVIGMGGMAGSFGGMLFPIFAGRLLDKLPGQGGYAILFTICGSLYLIALAFNQLLAPKFDRVKLD